MSQPHVLTELARAKVNLTLAILGRRPDGFHALDSVVAFADVGDMLTLTPGSSAAVSVTGPFAAAIEGDNLVARAIALVAERAPHFATGAIAIDKQLPVAAGLGGGSADAAAALRLLHRLNATRAGDLDWLQVAADLGSDVPACFHNHRCRMSGRGEMIEPIAAQPPLWAVLVNPRVAVPADKTRRVFQELGAAAYETAAGPRQIASITDGRNDLEAPAIRVMPAVGEVLAILQKEPLADVVRLSGAGPTCFAITRTSSDAAALAERVASQRPRWWVRATLLV